VGGRVKNGMSSRSVFDLPKTSFVCRRVERSRFVCLSSFRGFCRAFVVSDHDEFGRFC
jgi:hypothetical protein